MRRSAGSNAYVLFAGASSCRSNAPCQGTLHSPLDALREALLARLDALVQLVQLERLRALRRRRRDALVQRDGQGPRERQGQGRAARRVDVGKPEGDGEKLCEKLCRRRAPSSCSSTPPAKGSSKKAPRQGG